MDIFGIVVTLLMIFIPVVAKVMEKKAKEYANHPPVHPRDISIPVAEENAAPDNAPVVYTPVSAERASSIQSDFATAEGQPAVHSEISQPDNPQTTESKGYKLDKKKLIIYSEIMKPKFD